MDMDQHDRVSTVSEQEFAESVADDMAAANPSARAVDMFPDEPEVMAPEEEYKLTPSGRRKRISEIVHILYKYRVWDDITPVQLRCMLEELGPMFVKMGQILANQSEILPQQFCDELKRLRTDVDPVPYKVVVETIAAEYHRPLSDVFVWIAEKPLGSASLAQVHHAKLKTGEDVAVKVQRPGAQQVMAQDIDIMRSAAKTISKLFQNDQIIDLRDVVEELWESFREETNFIKEAQNLEDFYILHKDVDGVSCPRPYMQYCTEHIVVMDYIDGIPISEPDELIKAGYDLEKVGATIVDDYASQVLDDGFFHADPHDGNIILKGGIVYFIDLGMVGRMDAQDRAIMRDIIFAVADYDTPKLKDSVMRFAVSRDNASTIDHAALLNDIDYILEDYASLDLKDLDIGAFLNSLISLARRYDIELPGAVTMFARGMVTLEGLLSEYMPNVNMVTLISNHIANEKSTFTRMQEASEDAARSAARSAKGFMEAGENLGLASKMLTRGQLKVNTQVLGSDSLLRNFGSIVDRLSMAIVIAGLFIGSSVVYYAKIEPVIFGIPVIGFIGYVCALVLALMLGWRIWNNSHGKKNKKRSS